MNLLTIPECGTGNWEEGDILGALDNWRAAPRNMAKKRFPLLT